MPRLQGGAAGRERLNILRDLAAGEMNHAEIAVKYKREESNINTFAGRHQELIFAMRTDPTQIVSALWLANLEDRIATYQADIELIEAFQEDSQVPQGKLLRVKHQAMRYAADELGQLPIRNPGIGDGSDTVKYSVEGVEVGNIAEPANPETDK
jgi:hypothetical protein